MGYFKHWGPSAAGCIALSFDWLCGIIIIGKYSCNMIGTKEAELNVQYLFLENVGYLFIENCTDLPPLPSRLLALLAFHEKYIINLVAAAVCSLDRRLSFLVKAAAVVFVFNLHKHEQHTNKESWRWHEMSTFPFTCCRSPHSPPFKQGCSQENE